MSRAERRTAGTEPALAQVMADTKGTIRKTKIEMLVMAIATAFLAISVLFFSNHMNAGLRELNSTNPSLQLYRGVLKTLSIAIRAVFPAFAIVYLLCAFFCIRWLRAIRSPQIEPSR
jgi:ABC-type multidrug transport system permease subunit